MQCDIMGAIRLLYGMEKIFFVFFLQFSAAHFTGNKFICYMQFNRKSFYFVALLTNDHRGRMEEENAWSIRSHQQQLTKIKRENNHFLSSNNHIKAIFMAIAISNREGDRAPFVEHSYFIFIYFRPPSFSLALALAVAVYVCVNNTH